MKMTYTPHYKDQPEGHIFIKKSGACTITLTGAAAMTQDELNKFGKLFANADKMQTVLHKLIDSLPELDSEDEPLEGSEAVSILCQLWDEMKKSVE